MELKGLELNERTEKITEHQNSNKEGITKIVKLKNMDGDIVTNKAEIIRVFEGFYEEFSRSELPVPPDVKEHNRNKVTNVNSE
ncbi:hypothetical protein HHI36_019943 [Cryptolaemus montrouzieri]|uniref:Uncharacterized protein n=1 Tax=Cryptolaemus montrouzieri TaxID=559131 RepID=A0ABD2N8S8_9CUCU